MQLVRDPDPEAALAFLLEGIRGLRERRGHLLEILGECQVEYKGRARSQLSRGERLILLKPDGTLLVHTAQKAKPVNWMPPGDTEFAGVPQDIRGEK